MVLLFYVDDCLMLIPPKYKIDEVYASLQEYFKMEDDEVLNKYLGIEMHLRPDCSINLRKTYITQSILDIIPGIDNSSGPGAPAGDLNMTLTEPENGRRGTDIAAALTEEGLEDMATHFLLHQRKWVRESRTWSMVREGKVVRSRTDYILGIDRRLF